MSNVRSGVLGKAVVILAFFLLLGSFFYFDVGSYLSFQAFKKHHIMLADYIAEHYLLAVVLFGVGYAALVALSVPGALILTIAAGHLFGTLEATVYVVFSATLGAVLVFLASRYVLRDFFEPKVRKYIPKIEKELQQNAFSYMLFLRLVPLFPFFVVNIIPALLNVGIRPYIITTFFGIIPGTLVYASVGRAMSHILERDETPNFGLIFEWQILLPMVGLGLLSLVPIIAQKIKAKSLKNKEQLHD